MERHESSLRAPRHGKARGKPVRMTSRIGKSCGVGSASREAGTARYCWSRVGRTVGGGPRSTLHEGGQQGGRRWDEKGAEGGRTAQQNQAGGSRGDE